MLFKTTNLFKKYSFVCDEYAKNNHMCDNCTILYNMMFMSVNMINI